jgi:hypothetical protein
MFVPWLLKLSASMCTPTRLLSMRWLMRTETIRARLSARRLAGTRQVAQFTRERPHVSPEKYGGDSALGLAPFQEESMPQVCPISLSTVQNLLRTTFPHTFWILTEPDHGQQKQCYIATSHDQAVFVKFDSAPFAILRRLRDLTLTPRVLAGGTVQGRAYVIQEYLIGVHPWGWRWFPANLPLLARTIRRYHSDSVLRDLLAKETQQLSYAAHVHAELVQLERHLASLTLDPPLATELAKALAELTRQAQQLQPVALVPVHGDPNGLNFILAQEQLYLVDWDDICLADPTREIGQWLCWYVAQEQWLSFFADYGGTVDQALIDRLFWWSARASLANALWHLSRRYPYEVFVQDCWDALRQQMVPHQVFVGT